MTLKRFSLAVLLLAGLSVPAHAQNKQDMQMFADLRMLQESVQKLQLTVNTLIEQLKGTNTQVDANRNQVQKVYADLRLQNEAIASAVATLNEKQADSSVNVLKLTQEMASIRGALTIQSTMLNQIIGLLQPPIATVIPPGGETPAGATPAPGGSALPASPATHYNEAWGYYTANKFNLAIDAYEEALKKFPEWPDAPNAQVNIGNAYYQLRKDKDAVAAFNLVLTKYKDSDAVPDALFGQGLAYERLGQKALALKNYERIMSQYPRSDAAILAKTVINRVKGG
jgi:tol-pal system protein YbgF